MNDNYWSQENTVGTGAGISSSVRLLNGNLIFGALDNFVYSLKPENGEIMWKFKTNGPVYSTPATCNNNVYAGSCDGFVYAIGQNGNLVWKFNSQGRIMNSSMVCDGKRILFGTDNGVFFALDMDGKLLWKFPTGGAIRTTPAMVNDKIIFGSHDHNIYCLNEKGQKEWKFLAGGNIWTCPCIIKNGKLLWSINNQTAKTSREFLIYFGCFDGGLYCIDENGNFTWKFHTNGPNTSGPEFDSGILYFGSSDGYLYALNEHDRSLEWKYGTSGRIGHSSPLITENDIFMSSFNVDESSTSGALHCLDKKGKVMWKFRTEHAIVSTPLVHKNALFFGSWDGFLYAVSLKKKELLWKFRTLFEKINFDSSKAVKHMELEEERSKNILTTWNPEVTQKGKIKNVGYDQTSGYTKNVTLYGDENDSERFSYALKDYGRKRVYGKNGSYPKS